MAVDSVFNSVTKELLKRPVKIIFAGKGGQGILTASDISAQAFLLSGYDVKKSDIKGIARRGGKVLSTLVAGERIYSPKIIPEMADIAVVMSTDIELKLSKNTLLILPSDEDAEKYHKSLNMFCIGKLSAVIGIPVEKWEQAIRERFEDGVLGINLSAFYDGRRSAGIVEVS